jgi:hypothetical protein
MGGSLEVMGSPVRPHSRAANQAAVCRARMLVQQPREVPVYETTSGRSILIMAHPLEDKDRQNI